MEYGEKGRESDPWRDRETPIVSFPLIISGKPHDFIDIVRQFPAGLRENFHFRKDLSVEGDVIFGPSWLLLRYAVLYRRGQAPPVDTLPIIGWLEVKAVAESESLLTVLPEPPTLISSVLERLLRSLLLELIQQGRYLRPSSCVDAMDLIIKHTDPGRLVAWLRASAFPRVDRQMKYFDTVTSENGHCHLFLASEEPRLVDGILLNDAFIQIHDIGSDRLQVIVQCYPRYLDRAKSLLELMMSAYDAKLVGGVLADGDPTVTVDGPSEGDEGEADEGEKPWTKIPDHGWDREALELWWQGYTASEIGEGIGQREGKTVLNRMSSLRRQYGPDIVPTDDQRRKMKLK